MLKLVYTLVKRNKGPVRCEELFTAGEKRTAVEVARSRKDEPDRYCDVTLFDFSMVKGQVVTVLPTNPDAGRHVPVEVSRKTCKVPACIVVDLSKLPRKAPAKKTPARKPVKVAATAEAFDLPTEKPARRKTKRERTFGTGVVS